jgi:hypothetical protein
MYITELEAGLVGLDRFQAACVSLSCVECITPFVLHFAETITQQTYDELAKIFWRTVEARENVVDAKPIFDRIMDLPERQLDDSNLLSFDVTNALGVLFYTAECIASDTSALAIKAATAACESTLGFGQSLDFNLFTDRRSIAQHCNTTREIGHYEQLLQSLQLDAIRDSRKAQQLRQSFKSIHLDKAIAVAGKINAALPTYSAIRIQ